MKTILEVLTLSTEHLKRCGIANARRQAEDLVADALQTKRLQLYIDFERPVTDAELEVCRTHLSRRSKGEPLQYIRGFVDFCDCRIQVAPGVLIPRQETEILAEKIIQELEKVDCKEKVLWDMCTGSGCLGIAIKKRIPDLTVILSDLSEEALAIAKRNADGLQVQFRQGDLFEPFAGEMCDFFVCNPPYISENEFKGLDGEVKDFEPKGALVSGPSGLEFYQRLSAELPRFLKKGGKAWFELGRGQGEAVRALFPKGHYEKDWSGHDRFFFLDTE